MNMKLSQFVDIHQRSVQRRYAITAEIIVLRRSVRAENVSVESRYLITTTSIKRFRPTVVSLCYEELIWTCWIRGLATSSR